MRINITYQIGKSKKNKRSKKRSTVLKVDGGWTYKEIKEALKEKFKTQKTISIVKVIACWMLVL